MSSLASRLDQAMKEAGLNQSELARRASTAKVKVYQQNVQQILGERNKTTSKHLPALARALGVNLEWLTDGRGPRKPELPKEALLIGKVGAGAEIVRLEHPDVLAGVPLPPGMDAPNAAVVEGDSQPPLQDGWIVFYGPEGQGVSEKCIGQFCVVKVKDGPVLLKTLRMGSRKGLWDLESSNPRVKTRTDQRLEWAALVMDIRPR